MSLVGIYPKLVRESGPEIGQKMLFLFIHTLLSIFYLSLCNPLGTLIDAQHRKNIDYAIIPTKYRLIRYRRSRTTFTSMAEMLLF